MKAKLTLLIILISFFSFAQKVKVKKGQVLIDGVAVAKFEEPIRLDYIITSLDNSNSIKVTYKTLKITEEVTKQWLIVSDVSGERKTEVEMEFFSFSMNLKKLTAELLIKKFPIITSNGIENLDGFFSEDRPNLTEEFNGLLSNQAGIEKEARAISASLNIDTDSRRIFEGNVPYTTSTVDDREREKGSYDNLIATYSSSISNGSNFPVFSIYDLDNHKVATASTGPFNEIFVTLPYQDAEFTYKGKIKLTGSSSEYQKGEFVKEVIGWLYVNEVPLGNQMNNERNQVIDGKNEVAWSEYEDAKTNSSNLYDVNGYVVDEEGVKYEGNITMEWENIPSPQSVQGDDSGMVVNIGSGNYGSSVQIKYLNEKEKSRFKHFKSKDGVDFYAKNEDGSEIHYKGITIVKSNSKTDSKFYEILEENTKITFFTNPSNKNNAGIIIPGKKGFMFIIANKEKNYIALKEYLNCDLPVDFKNSIDYSNPSEIKKLSEYYMSSCN